MYKEPGCSDVAGPKTVAETIRSYLKEELVNKNIIKAAGLALAIALVPAAAKAVQVVNSEDVKLDVGGRMQLQGDLEYSGNPNYVAASPISTTTGNGNRDFTRIFLFQKQNRLTLNADLKGVKVKFEAPFGSEAYTGSNNLYTLHEFSAEIPMGTSFGVVAGLAKMPWNQASATYTRSFFSDANPTRDSGTSVPTAWWRGGRSASRSPLISAANTARPAGSQVEAVREGEISVTAPSSTAFGTSGSASS